MTKKAKIAELEFRLREAEKQIGLYVKKIEKYEEAQKATPEDCSPGAWCEACVFCGNVHIRLYDYDPCNKFACSRPVKLRFCNKGVCKNFVREEVPENDRHND